jgi:hypothetical protein
LFSEVEEDLLWKALFIHPPHEKFEFKFTSRDSLSSPPSFLSHSLGVIIFHKDNAIVKNTRRSSFFSSKPILRQTTATTKTTS